MIINCGFVLILTVPTGTPRNVIIRGLTKTSAEISWDPPPVEERRGFIKEYRVVVEYYEDGKTKNKTYEVPERSIVVTGADILTVCAS